MSDRPVLDDVTVIIPTLGRPTLEGCLASIADGDAWPARLTAVHQGTDGDVPAWIQEIRSRGLSAEYRPCKATGVAAGRNRGIDGVRTRFFVITDDDCLVEPDWLRSMTDRLRASPDSVVTGRVDPGAEGVLVSLTHDTVPIVHTRPRLRDDFLYAGNMGCALSTYRKIGPFDEREFLRYAEDNDWAYRALRAGASIIFHPDAAVRHTHWRSEEALVRTYADYAYSQGGFYGKHLRGGDPFIALRVGITLLRGGRRWVAGAVRGNTLRRRNGWVTMTRLLPGVLNGIRNSS